MNTMVSDFLADVRHSLRMLRRSPVFGFTAICALTVGIGANTAIFSVVSSVLFARLPYPDSDRIVRFMTVTPSGPFTGASPTKLNLWKEHDSVFQEVSGYRFRFANLGGGARPEQVPIGEVSTDFFRLFRASFERGRGFTADEQRPAGPKVAIASDGFVRRRFGTKNDAVGQAIWLDREAYTVVGVLDPGFDGAKLAGPVMGNPEVWVPLQLDPNSRDQTNSMVAVGRLAPGRTLEDGRSQLQGATQQFREMFPGIIGPKDSFNVEGLRDTMVQDVRGSLLVLQGAVGVLLLIACANVASLLLVRSTARVREIAVKTALGAGRGRIIRQLITESLVLSVIGGALGVRLGTWCIQVLLALYPANLVWVPQVALDRQVLGFTVLVTAFTGLLAGLFPALQVSRSDLNIALKESSTHFGSYPRQGRVRSVLVGAEIALAVVLVVGTALLARTFVALRSVDAGFHSRGVLTLRMSLGESNLAHATDVDRLVRTAVQRLSTVPGVEVTSASCCLPLENDMRLRFIIIGRPLEGPYHGMGSWRSVSPDYFDALRIPLVRGRVFTEQDRLGRPGVVIINQTMARQLWRGGDPLNDSLLIGKGLGPRFAAEPIRRIVGIAGDVRDAALTSAPRPTTYVPIAQLPDTVMEQTMGPLPLTWIVRTSGESQRLRRAIQGELERVSKLPVAHAQPLSDIMRQSISDKDFYLTVMSALGGAALLLAVIGLNGVIRYVVQQRTKEIGLRLALGAEPGEVRNMIVFQGMRLTFAAVAIGIVGAFTLARFLAAFLFGVTERDPIVFVSVPVVVIVAALFAVWLPARAIARMDLVSALRHE